MLARHRRGMTASSSPCGCSYSEGMSSPEPAPVNVDRLMALDLFAHLDHHDLAQVSHWVHEVRAGAGEFLFEQGDLPYEFFVIESGDAEVVRDGDVLARIGPGELVGEMALLRGERRMASVRAVGEVIAIALSADDLAAIEEEMPEVVRAMRATTEDRVRRNAELDPGSGN